MVMVYSDFSKCCFSLVLYDKKEKLVQYKEYNTKIHFYFVESVYSISLRA